MAEDIEVTEKVSEIQDTQEVEADDEAEVQEPVKAPVSAPVETNKSAQIEVESGTIAVEFTESMRFDWRGTIIEARKGTKMKVSKDLKEILIARDCIKVL